MNVNVDNFIRAETDNYFARHAQDAGGIGRFLHIRQPTQPKYQPVIRMNRDTVYSVVVLDLAEPATIVFPDAGGRFISMMVVNEDHYVKLVAYDAGEYMLTADKMGTRYAEVIFRAFVDANGPEDIKAANALQDCIQVKQKAPGVLELPQWDLASLSACRAALLELGAFAPDLTRTFGDVGVVDPVRHLLGTANGWGGNPEQDATYALVSPERNDGQTPHILELKDVPVDGFWSLTVYNADGYLEPNEYGAYSVNSVTAAPNPDGSFEVHFGGDPAAGNYLHIMPGWNYAVRMYRPRLPILDGRWRFPVATPVT